MAFKQILYSDFSGGYNDTSATISVDDNQTCMSENVEYSAEVRALQTRKGQTIYETIPLSSASIADMYSWEIGHITQTAVLFTTEVDLKQCSYMELFKSDGTSHSLGRINFGATKMYPFVMYNTMYFGDGTTLWEIGGYDTSFEAYVSGDNVWNKDGVIRYYKNNDFPNVKGTSGHFYRHVYDSTQDVDITIPDELDFDTDPHWEDVTDGGVVGLASGFMREVRSPNVGKKEKMEISFTSASPSHSGILNAELVRPSGETDVITTTVTVSQTLTTVATNFANAITNDTTASQYWTATVNGSKVIVECKVEGATTGSEVTFYPSSTSYYISTSLVTLREGADNDANLDAIKKCTIFTVHNGSFRVFAAGNPNDTALYYSELGNPRYWKSSINKVYPAVNGYGSVTGIINLSDYLLVSYERGWYYWKGSTPLTDAYWKPMNIPYGCVSPRTLVLTPNSFTFLAREGIYNVSVAILSDEYILLQTKQVIQKLSENVVEKTIESIVNPEKCEGIFWHNSYLLSYWTKSGDEDVQNVLKYEWDTGSFTLITGWSPVRFTQIEDKLLCGSGRYLLNCFDGLYDVDVETGLRKKIVLHVKTKEYTFGSTLTNKIIQHIGLVFQQHTNLSSELRVILRYNYRTHEFKLQDLTESFTWGRRWGGVWGWADTITKMIETIMDGSSFQLEFIDDRTLEEDEIYGRHDFDNPVTLLAIGFIYEVTDYLNPTTYKDSDLLE